MARPFVPLTIETKMQSEAVWKIDDIRHKIGFIIQSDADLILYYNIFDQFINEIILLSKVAQPMLDNNKDEIIIMGTPDLKSCLKKLCYPARTHHISYTNLINYCNTIKLQLLPLLPNNGTTRPHEMQLLLENNLENNLDFKTTNKSSSLVKRIQKCRINIGFCNNTIDNIDHNYTFVAGVKDILNFAIDHKENETKEKEKAKESKEEYKSILSSVNKFNAFDRDELINKNGNVLKLWYATLCNPTHTETMSAEDLIWMCSIIKPLLPTLHLH